MKVAVLDMYDQTENLGLQSILDILATFDELEVEVFEVRSRHQLPDLEFNLYIFSGGPGDPREVEPEWSQPFYQLIDNLWEYNKHQKNKKYLFFICHSFQMACHHFGIGKISKRREASMGIFPVIKTPLAQFDFLFQYLPNPFYAADFRSYQVIEADHEQITSIGAEILAIERERRKPEYPRAIMAVRFSPEIYGTQFHPEAYHEGMINYFSKDEKRKEIAEIYGAYMVEAMQFYLRDPIKLPLTFERVLPGFITHAFASINELAQVNI